jgi:hypothetical protein
MTPILTHNERLARDSDYQGCSEEVQSCIENTHLKAEVKELREALGNRTIAYIPSEHDLAILKGLKREFVDRMIGSGLQYNLCGNVSGLLETMLKDLQDNITPK